MIWEWIGAFFILFGMFFNMVGVIGIIRLPDSYSRLHASGKVAILGLFGMLLGTSFLMPSAALKALGLGLFMFFTAPVVSHAIAVSTRRFRDIRPQHPEADSGENPPTPTSA